MAKQVSYIHEAIHTVTSIVKGHLVTLRNLFRKKVTLQYPEQRWPLPPGYRGAPSLPVDTETGKDLCIGCQACVRTCPTQLITVPTHVGEDKKRVVDGFEMKMELCMFCGLCEEICPVDAIKLSPDYELAEFDRKDFIYNREKLNEIGGTRAPKPKPEKVEKPVDKPEAKEPAKEE